MKNKYDKDFLIYLLEKMMVVRKFEEKIQALFSDGVLHGTTHLGIGEEGTAVGATMALENQDYIFATHRGHGQVIGKGADVNAVMAEMFGKKTGVSLGLGGSMHLADIEKGIFGTNGIVGANLAIACGTAFSIKTKKEKDKIAVAFFGDGATNEGVVHESMNIASVWNLPILFVLVNNGYSVSKKLFEMTKNTNLLERAKIYDMKAYEVDGNNALEVFETVKKAREEILKENAPILIVANTYRLSGHSKSDNNLYRNQEEIEKWQNKDPIKALIGVIGCSKDEIVALENNVDNIIKEAVDFAKNSPEPTIEDILDRVYAK